MTNIHFCWFGSAVPLDVLARLNRWQNFIRLGPFVNRMEYPLARIFLCLSLPLTQELGLSVRLCAAPTGSD